MDLFGRKRIAQLQEDLAQADEALATEKACVAGFIADMAKEQQVSQTLRNQIEYLVRTIRDMDQEIWNMAQKTDWNQQRPHFTKLHEGTIARKHAESNRISDILRGELIDTYTPGNAQKRLK